MQATNAEDMCDISEIDDEEIESINRDLEERIITKFRFHANN